MRTRPRSTDRRTAGRGRRPLARVAALLALAAGLAATRAVAAEPAPACQGLDAEQDGAVVSPADGVIALARRPFVLRLRTQGHAPGLHVARDGRLAAALAASQQPVLWLSAGDVLAGEPGRLLVDGRFELRGPTERQTAFAAAFGDSALRLMGSGAAGVSQPTLAGLIPRNTEFEREASTDRFVYPVNRIGGAAPGQGGEAALHLVVFTARRGAASEPPSLFFRSDWSPCVLRFRP